MIIRYKESKDPRITKKRTFLKEYIIILSVMLVCCAGAILMFNKMMELQSSPEYMALCIGSYVLFMCLIISLATRYIMYTGFMKPVNEFGLAARRVAQGDFTVRIRPKRKDDKKDEIDVFIQDFNKMVEELSTIETLKTDFISNVSHEIKTPLAIISSYATALKKSELSEEEKDNYIQTILEASKKLTLLVSNILRLNKLENQEIIQMEEFSLDEQLRQCILAFDEKFDEKQLELEIELEEVYINSDESLLELVWNNLLTNAIKFTEPNGGISISLKKQEDVVMVRISDSGCGMGEETVHRVFDRFYQGDTSHYQEGNGLGLSLVKRVIDLVSGEISVESQKGEGTTFTVTLSTK